MTAKTPKEKFAVTMEEKEASRRRAGTKESDRKSLKREVCGHNGGEGSSRRRAG
ncbi:MAG: hypothetical protein IIU28_06055 [Lachnospiraceae bacterium]|nr:hypothetical protein [Lachnospiraceae bacterium]